MAQVVQELVRAHPHRAGAHLHTRNRSWHREVAGHTFLPQVSRFPSGSSCLPSNLHQRCSVVDQHEAAQVQGLRALRSTPRGADAAPTAVLGAGGHYLSLQGAQAAL